MTVITGPWVMTVFLGRPCRVPRLQIDHPRENGATFTIIDEVSASPGATVSVRVDGHSQRWLSAVSANATYAVAEHA